MEESQNIEHKESWRDEYLKWICGFANAQGGRVYIGVNDDRQVVGLEESKKLMEDIPNKIRDVLGIIVDVNLLKEDDKEYIEIVVPPYSNPINYKGQYHYRSGSTKQELKGASLNKFLLERGGIHWDEFVVPNVKVTDLSGEAFKRFRKEAAESGRVDKDVLEDSNETLLTNLLLVDEHTGQLKRSAAMLFHPSPEKFVSGAYIKLGFFAGEDDDLVFQDEVHGPLMLQVDEVIRLLEERYLIHAISYEKHHRRERIQYPEDSLRESLLNAIINKDYTSGYPIQISVYPDHLSVWNYGHLPEGWPVGRLFVKHPSMPFNPSLANVFFRSGDIESWGRGYRRIVRKNEEAGLLPPLVETEDGLRVTHYADVSAQIRAMGVEERVIPVLEQVLKNHRVTNGEVQQLLGVSKPTATRLLQKLNVLLEQVGHGAGAYYKIRNY
ncbi:MAG: putative DNA binding domain-containing protein [Bacteroidales bacterium]|nr:putative DNA binding domain-containing protein [Bacteroidales bacterium]